MTAIPYADQLEARILRSLCDSIESEVELEKHTDVLRSSRDQRLEIILSEIKRVTSELEETKRKEADILNGLVKLNSQDSSTAIKWLEDQARGVWCNR